MPLHTDAEIDRLEELLSNIEVIPDAMCASALDGYVAGLLLCPEMILPSEWLPEVWGLDREPEFRSIEEDKATIDAVMSHYNRVSENLSSRTAPYEVVLEPADGECQPFWDLWIAGFYQAMRLRPDAWRSYADADDSQVASAFSCICGLVEIQLGESPLPNEMKDSLEEHAANLIPEMVVRMNDWIKSQSPFALSRAPDWFAAANTNSVPLRSIKVGRDETCPCGSGRKHERCCGAN